MGFRGRGGGRGGGRGRGGFRGGRGRGGRGGRGGFSRGPSRPTGPIKPSMPSSLHKEIQSRYGGGRPKQDDAQVANDSDEELKQVHRQKAGLRQEEASASDDDGGVAERKRLQENPANLEYRFRNQNTMTSRKEKRKMKKVEKSQKKNEFYMRVRSPGGSYRKNLALFIRVCTYISILLLDTWKE